MPLEKSQLDKLVAECTIKQVAQKTAEENGLITDFKIRHARYTQQGGYTEEAQIVEAIVRDRLVSGPENEYVMVQIGGGNITFVAALMAHFLQVYRNLAILYHWSQTHESGVRNFGLKAIFRPNTSKVILTDELIQDLVKNELARTPVAIDRLINREELEATAAMFLTQFMK